MQEDLKTARYLNLGTMRKNGILVNTPVWFAWADNKYFVFSARNAGKVKRLRNFSTANIAPCTATGKLLGEWIAAECSFAGPEEELLAYQLLKKKYGWQMYLTDFFSWLSGKINNRIVLVITTQ